jgi:hypothetical protein
MNMRWMISSSSTNTRVVVCDILYNVKKKIDLKKKTCGLEVNQFQSWSRTRFNFKLFVWKALKICGCLFSSDNYSNISGMLLYTI